MASVSTANPMGRFFEAVEVGAILPKRATEYSAGYDMYANEDVVIPAGSMKIVSTGVAAFIPHDEFLDLRIRSGMSTKGIIFLNACGVIDSDYYPNVIKCIMFNLSVKDYVIKKGDRIAQGIFHKYEVTTNDVEDHKDTRVGGLGSTGGN